IDPAKALDYKEKKGSVVGLSGTSEISNEDLLELDVDILIPAALENAITGNNASKIRAKIISEVANGPTTPEADKILAKNGVFLVPDILANAGGVTVSYLEWVQNLSRQHWTEQVVNEELERKMVSGFKAVHDFSKKYGVPMRDAALAIAVSRVADAIKTLGVWP
ncbi:MAG: Glu/Leu/Phe/Val family dehydrogenase, partial [Nitrososphaerales archaeon]